MKLLVTVVLMLVVATLVADAWLVKRRHRSRFVRRFHRKVIKHHARSSSSSSSTIERRCHFLCQKEPRRTQLIETICPDLCDAVVCRNGGTCNNGVCTCAEGFTGQFCADVIDPCATVVCENNGTCNDDGECECSDGFVGEFCADVDPCSTVLICQNGGTCTNGMCRCTEGFIGDICDVVENPCTYPNVCRSLRFGGCLESDSFESRDCIGTVCCTNPDDSNYF